MDESMSPDSLSGMLSSLPEDKSISVMKRLTEKGEYVLMDSAIVPPILTSLSKHDRISILISNATLLNMSKIKILS
jgi:hypothetical protein